MSTNEQNNSVKLGELELSSSLLKNKVASDYCEALLGRKRYTVSDATQEEGLWFPGLICRRFSQYDVDIWTSGESFFLLGEVWELHSDSKYIANRWVVQIQKSDKVCNTCNNNIAWRVLHKYFETARKHWAVSQFEQIHEYECRICLGKSIKNMYHVKEVGTYGNIFLRRNVTNRGRKIVWPIGFEVGVEQEVEHLIHEHTNRNNPQRPTRLSEVYQGTTSKIAFMARTKLIQGFSSAVSYWFREKIEEHEDEWGKTFESFEEKEQQNRTSN